MGLAPPAKPYTVRLHFAEREQLKAGQRVFDVYLQRQKVLEAFDIVKQSGGSRIPVTREIPAVHVTDELHVELHPTSDTVRLPVLSGIEIVRE